jgi:hypothetical protein
LKVRLNGLESESAAFKVESQGKHAQLEVRMVRYFFWPIFPCEDKERG